VRVASIAAALVLAGLAAAPAAGAATTLYPDLQVLPPRDIHLDRVDVSGGDTPATGTHNVLRFTNTVWNQGPGDLVIRGAPPSSNASGPAFQRIYDSDGGFTERNAGNVIFHPQHNHYHYEGWGLYQLWTAADYDAWDSQGRPAHTVESTGAKTTSCILDQEFIGGPGTHWPHHYGFGGCLPDSGGQLLEGLSTGWGDTYSSWRYDQWIDLDQRTLADGNYVLRTIVNPSDQMAETSTANDDNIERFTIAGGQIVDSDPPTGTVTLNDVDGSTDNPEVTLKVLGRDDVSGVDSFRVSNDDSHWSSPITYEGHDSTPHSMRWNLTDPQFGGTTGLGTKTVYVQVHDAAGRTSTVSHSIDLVALRPGTPYSRTVRDDNPISHWRLDEGSAALGASDDVGGNHGQYGGSPALGSPGLIGSEPTHTAAAFHGQDYAYFAHTSSQDLTTHMTLEAWVKPTAFPAPGDFASVVSKPESYSLQFDGDQLEFTVIADPANDPPGGDRGRERLRLDPGDVPLNQASHIVGTYDGTTQRLYVNGVLRKSRALSRPAQVNTNEITIGSWQFGLSEFFTGTIDEVAIYPTALTAGQVRSHYDVAQAPAQPPPAPQNLAAAAASSSRVDLTWGIQSHVESSFVVERGTDAGFSHPASIDVAENRTSYADTGLSPGQQYWYRIRALNPIGSSDWSNEASATTPGGTTGAPEPSPAEQQTGPPAPGHDPPPAPGDTAPPLARLSIRTQTLDQVLRRGLAVQLRSNGPGRAATRLLSGRTLLGKASTRLTKAGTKTIVIKLTSRARRLLKGRRSAKLTIETTVTDSAGKLSVKARRNVTLRAARR
jgi:hypothetical protein